MSSPSSSSLPSGTELESYRIVRRVGVGGMGSVYEAEHTGLGRRVALKTLNPELADNPELRARFVREGQAVAKIHHPNIVGVSHVGSVGGMTFLVMDFLEGEDLASRIAREGALPVAEAVEVVLPVISAIEAAHEAGVIHRDLKPANIFLERTRREVVPKVLDFGISKVSDKVGDVTRSVALLGSPHYMSPEQARSSKSVDWRTDLYAIGVILYECLTGRRPFNGETIFELVFAISSEDAAPPSEVNPALPKALDAIVQRAMARRPDDRYPSLRALALELIPFAPPESQNRYRNEFAPRDSDAAARSSVPSRDPQALVDTLMSASREVPKPSPAPPARPSLPLRFAVAASLGAALVVGGIALTRSDATTPRPAAPPRSAEPAPPPTPIPAPAVAPSPEPPAPVVAQPAEAVDAAVAAPPAPPPVATETPAPQRNARTRRARESAPAAAPAAAPAPTPTPAPTPPPARPTNSSDDEFRVR